MVLSSSRASSRCLMTLRGYDEKEFLGIVGLIAVGIYWNKYGIYNGEKFV